jgi:hypothetical protein
MKDFIRSWFKRRDGTKEAKGGFEKVEEWPKEFLCQHPEHNPPTHIVLRPAVYIYTCPACGARQRVEVWPKATLNRSP